MDKKRKILIAVLIALLVLLIVGIVTACVILIQPKDPADDNKIVPDYPPQETDPNQSPMENDPGGTLELESGGAGVNLTYHSTATVDLSEGKVFLHYANPSKSTQDMVVSLVLESGDVLICRSQRIIPGNQINELELEESVRDQLEVGAGYNAKYVVGCYDPNTNEKAMVELVGSGVVVTVVE